MKFTVSVMISRGACLPIGAAKSFTPLVFLPSRLIGDDTSATTL
jgi:hypothetical protein